MGQPIEVVPCNEAGVPVLGSWLTGFEHDYIALSYTGDDLTTAVFKTGGAGGAIVATLTLTYSGDHKLLTVTRT